MNCPGRISCKKGPGAVGSGDECERDGFRPSRGSVDDGEQIGVDVLGRQWPDQVDVDVVIVSHPEGEENH